MKKINSIDDIFGNVNEIARFKNNHNNLQNYNTNKSNYENVCLTIITENNEPQIYSININKIDDKYKFSVNNLSKKFHGDNYKKVA